MKNRVSVSEDEDAQVNRFDRRGSMDTARQSRNQRQDGLTAEYAEYAENRLLPDSPSAYSAVYLFPEASSPPANNLDYCSPEKGLRSGSL
jgi:hypothetical protein